MFADSIKFFLPSGGGACCSEMGTLFKSELMSRCQLYLPPEAAYNCVAELGELGMLVNRMVGEMVIIFYF